MTTCPQCGADMTDSETCRECASQPRAVTDPATDAAEQPPVADPPARWRRSRFALVAAAVGVVGVLVGGAAGFGLGRAHTGSAAAPSSAAGTTLALPSTLSGGYKRDKTVDTEIASSVSSARTTLGAGTDMAIYTHGKTEVLVQATRLPGKAMLSAGMTYAKVGDAICASTSSSSGSEAICSRTSDDLTVQVTATTSTTARKYVDEVYDGLA